MDRETFFMDALKKALNTDELEAAVNAAKNKNADVDEPVVCEACFREGTTLIAFYGDIICADAVDCISNWD